MKPKLIKKIGYLKPNEKSKYKRLYCIYQCPDCGKEFKAIYHNVENGNTKRCQTCGYKKSRMAKITHGDTIKQRTRLYNIWINMKMRCYNKNHPRFKDWGGKGIKVCEEWKNSFNAFKKWAVKNGYNDTLQLDRIDNNLGYSPDNCRFVDKYTQAQNKTFEGIKCVYKHTKNRYKAVISANGKRYYLGLFKTKKEGVEAYNNFVLKNNLNHSLIKLKEGV